MPSKPHNSQKNQQPPGAAATEAPAPEPSKAATYEAEYVQKVYDEIAPHFAATRYAPWPRVNTFIESLPNNSVLFDVGCGNGKYLTVSQTAQNNLFAIGTDLCAPLVSFAYKRPDNRYDVSVADALYLPLKTGTADAVISIAVVHHFCTRERRVAAIKEMIRVLREGGRALIYVWAIERQGRIVPKRGSKGDRMLNRRFEAQDMFVPWHMRRKKDGAESEKILGDWDEVHKRYYHVYKEGELESEIGDVKGAKVAEIYYDHQNWCAVIEKVVSTDCG